MTEPERISFQTANTAATHLGRKLYSSSPSALAELVANSYDAYATKVWIDMERQADSIIIADNGIGMSLETIRRQYATIGNPKPATVVPPTGIPERRPMGKKGIGKLASFSLGDSFTVYTKTAKDDHWLCFTLRYSEMIEQENAYGYDTTISYYDTLPLDLPEKALSSGFIVEISELRRKITTTTLDSLKAQITRRFSLRNTEFQILLNNKEIDLCATDILYKHIEAVNYAGFADSDISDSFPMAKKIEQYAPSGSSSITSDDFDELIKDHHVRAWVGVVDKPARLTQIGLGGILVYINGKIADEDLLKNKKSAQMGGRYVTGEIHADYLNDNTEDPITSSRQGLDQTDDDVKKLTRLATAMEGKAISQWDSLKDKEAPDTLPQRIRDNQKYQNWEKGLTKQQRFFNTKLLRTMAAMEDYGDRTWMSNPEKVSFINGITTLVESLELLDLSSQISTFGNDDDILYSIIARYLGNVARQDRIQMADAAAKRLNAIDQLQELVNKDKEVEKAFEQQLFNNPWLLNPFWNRTTKSDEEIKINRQRFVELVESQQDAHKRGYIDIYIEVAEKALPIVVELKRNDGQGHSSNVTMSTIIDQIDKYRKGLFDKFPPETTRFYSYMDIEAVFIAPPRAFGNSNGPSTLTEREIVALSQMNITVRTYDDLLRDARTSYQDFFKAHESSRELPYFSFDVFNGDDTSDN